MQQQSGNQLFRAGDAPNPIPQYMISEQQRSTDSNGSQDSIKTQLPLSYHSSLSSDVCGQDYKDSSQFGYKNAWNSSDTEGSTFDASRNSSSKLLNPNSSPYVPKSRVSAAANNEVSQNFNGQNNFKDDGQENYSNSLYTKRSQAQIGYPPLPNPNPYRQQDSTASHFQHQHGINHNPHGSFGIESLANGFRCNNNGYETDCIESQTLTHGREIYPNPEANSYNSDFAASGSQSRGWAQACNFPSSSGPSNRNYNTYRESPAVINLKREHGMSNGCNRINEHYNGYLNNGGNQNTSQSTNQFHSNKSVTPAHFCSGQSSRPASTLTLASSLPPPNRSNSAVTCCTYTETDAAVSDNIEDSKDIPTPGPNPHVLDVQFSSEPRNNKTPTLRSRRGQSISTMSTDPPRKSTMTNWLDNIPSLGDALGHPTARIQSPPKMLRFNEGVNRTLASVHESDPFSDGPIQSTNLNNPFEQVLGASSLRAGSLLLSAGSGMSPQYRSLTRGGTRNPSIQEALDPQNLPFVEYCRNAFPSQWGVIRIKNIPYSVNRPEVLAFLGRNARIIAEAKHEPVHIVMERVTSKTLNCYVEFVNFQEAINAVNRFETNRAGGRGGRLGPRHVEVELSSQDQLMKELFPKAKNVIWRNGPQIMPRDLNDPYNSGFQGFVSKEELVMLVKHVEAPQRSPFSKDCPQRPFECLISTLLKYPWHMVDYITIQDRNLIHQATKDLLSLLVERVSTEKNDIHLNPTLLKRVWRAAMLCPGFTPSMKDDIVVICGLSSQTAIELGLAPLAAEWCFLWTIGPKANAPVDVLMYYIDLISSATIEQKPQLSLAEQAAQGYQNDPRKLFGDLDKFIQYPKGLASRTLAEIARSEWTAIEHALRRALTPAIETH